MIKSCLNDDHLAQKLADQEIIDALQNLIGSTQSLQLATLSKESETFASYTPFIAESNKLYIFVSELATHTQNLLLTDSTAIMLIEDEAKAKNIFARKRLMLNCQVNEIDRTSDIAEQIIDKMTEQLGNTLSVLRTLPDFHLFELIPLKGSYVQGFGQAYEI